MLELFDPKREFVVRRGALPHWYQPGVTYFVTFRTENSVPQPLLRSWHLRRDQWLWAHGIDPGDAHWETRLAATPGLEREFHERFTRAFMQYLDRGHGACPLRDPCVAEIAAGALLHFDGQRYELGDFVVMPNHVHAIVCLTGNTEIEAQCKSWKKFSAVGINRLLGRRGRFWQEESFDHLVRSGAQFEHFQRYIARNPQQARLREGEYLHWVRPK